MTATVRALMEMCLAGKRPTDHVLTREPGHRAIVDLREAWTACVTKAGLPKLRPHDLRRSAAKAARRAGVAESVIMVAGGWKTAAMFRRYAIVSSADQQDAVAKIEQARLVHSPANSPATGVKPS